MAKIVESIFGLSPEQVLQKQKAEDYTKAQNFGMLVAQDSPGYGALAQAFSGLGSNVIRGVQGLTGVQDPELKKAVAMQSIQKDLQNSLSKEDMQNPSIYFPTLTKKLSEAGYENEASQSLLMGNEEIDKYNKTKAQTRLTDIKLSAAEQDAKDEVDFKNDITALQEKAKQNGVPVTDNEILEVASKYSSADKLLGLMTTRVEKDRISAEATRRADIAYERQLEAAKRRKADARELELIRQNYKKEIEAIKQDNKSGKDNASSNERTKNSRIVVSANEVKMAVQNLNVLTNGGQTPATAGMFRDLEGKGVFSATAKWLGTAITPEDQNQYDSILRPVIFNIASLQSQGMAVRQFHMKNVTDSLLSQPGITHATQLVKMGEFRQVVDAAIEGSLTSSTLNEKERALLENVRDQVRMGIPFTGNDVLTFQTQNKDPEVTFKQWTEINGTGRGTAGWAEIDGKKEKRPPSASDEQWQKFIEDMGATNVGH